MSGLVRGSVSWWVGQPVVGGLVGELVGGWVSWWVGWLVSWFW